MKPARPTPPSNPRPTVVRASRHRSARLIGWLACLLISLAGSVAADPPPPFIIGEDTSGQSITVYSEHLHDAERRLSFADIISGDFDQQFRPALNDINYLGLSRTPWWLRVAVRNDSDHEQRRILELSPGLFSRISFFRPTDGGYDVQHSGTSVQPPWADLRHRKQLFELTIPAGTTHTYYWRVLPNHSLVYGLHLNSHAEQLHQDLMLDGLYLALAGLILGLALYHLGIWLVRRETCYLLYAAFLPLVVTAVLAAVGFLGVQYLSLAGLQPRLEINSILLGLLASVGFSRSFLDSRVQAPMLDRLLKAIMLLAVGILVMQWSAPLGWVFLATYATGLASAAGILLLAVRCRRQSGGRLHLLARTPAILLVLCITPASLGFSGLPVEAPLLVLAITALEALVLALGLSLRGRSVLRRQMEEASEKIAFDAAWQARSETLSRLSHEIRTPMSGILGMAEILQDTPLTPNQKECVGTIQQAGFGLLKLLNDVLDYSRIEQGDTELETTGFDITELLMESVDLYRERSEEKQIELIPHVHSNVPARVRADAPRLKQVMTNLLGICLRHAQPGELVIDLSRDMSGRPEHLSVELFGSALARAGESLQQMEAAGPEEKHPDSARLRLAIARQLIDAMGGQSGLHPGRSGPVLWFSIPAPADHSLAEQVDGALLEGRHLLVVDDSSTMTRVIRQQAISWGMRVTACHDAREGLASIRTQANLKDPYDIVVLDQDMPAMNGMQLAARIHDDPLLGKPPVIIMLTGLQNAPGREAARQAGINRVIRKPVSGPWLRQVLAEELGSGKPAALPDPAPRAPDLQANLRILVAEDHLLSQKVIVGMLGKLGVAADLVSHGGEVLDALRTRHYDMVLMDCEMPGVDGFEATLKIREWERSESRDPIPVVALTAHILREHRERSRQVGMNAHIPKPVELETLRDVIVQFTAFSPAVAGGSGPDLPRASDERPG